MAAYFASAYYNKWAFTALASKKHGNFVSCLWESSRRAHSPLAEAALFLLSWLWIFLEKSQPLF